MSVAVTWHGERNEKEEGARCSIGILAVVDTTIIFIINSNEGRVAATRIEDEKEKKKDVSVAKNGE